MLMTPVSLIFLSVPESSSASACAAKQTAASARPMIRRHFIEFSPIEPLNNVCRVRSAMECNLRPTAALATRRLSCKDRAAARADPSLHRLVGVGVRRIRRLGEFMLELRAHRHVEIKPLGGNLLHEPLVVDFLAVGSL